LAAAHDEAIVGEPGAGARTSAAGHLVDLPGERWALWRWACVRGAGFPVSDLLRLGAEDAAAAADRLLAAAAAADARRKTALAALRQGLHGGAEDERRRRSKAIRRLEKGQPPATPEPEALGFTAALAEVAAAREGYLQAHAAAQRRLSATLREAARHPALREAVTWQNRHALETGFDALLRQPPDGRRRRLDRRHEQLVASYLHRYCAKNDTIGFFGPIGWARVTDSPETLVARPGKGLVARRSVFFETWCIDAVAEALARDRPLRPWLAPRKLPFFLLQGNVYVPFTGTPSQLSKVELAAFEACTGRQTALELAARLLAEPRLGLRSAEEVLAALERLAARKMIVWQLEVPLDLHGEEALARILGRVEDPALREPMLAGLAELVARRDAVAAAAGDAERLGEALAALESRFQQVTGRDPRRLQGQVYAGRTLVHEDCRRDLEVEIGGGLLAALGPPLSLVLISARWLGEQIAHRFRREFQQAYAELCAQSRSQRIGLLQFLNRVRPVLLEGTSSVVTEAAGEHRRRWSEILAIPTGQRRAQFSSAELRPLVEEAFRARGPGWRHARQHSPDLLIRAPSVEAIRAGDYQVVLGEVHLAANTLRTALVVSQHPHPEELRQAMLGDIPEPTVIPWVPKQREGGKDKNPLGFDVPPTGARLELGLLSAKDLRLALDPDDPPSDPHATTLLLGYCLVTECDGELSVVTRDGKHRIEIIDFCEIAFSERAVNSFRLLPPAPYTPRITIDRLIVHRETWRLPLGETGFPAAGTEEERFLLARGFMRRHGMPRHVFVRSPYENKPFFVDFASPAAIEILARACRRAIEKGGDEIRIGISEMVPEPEQCWLPGPGGERYTSEIRFVIVDRSPAAAGG
jgi:hypothetical protein